MISVRFQGKPFSIIVIQAYALTNNTEEAEVEWFYQTKLQQHVNHELPVVQAVFRKGRGTRDQIANIRWIIEKARKFQKNIYFCFTEIGRAHV